MGNAECASVAAGAASVGKCLVRKVGPFNWSSHALVYRVAFECTGSPFRAGGLLRAPHISNLRKEQMEILIADAVFFFFFKPSRVVGPFGFWGRRVGGGTQTGELVLTLGEAPVNHVRCNISTHLFLCLFFFLTEFISSCKQGISC